MDGHIEAINLARRHHRAGRLSDAEKIYRQVLAQEPDHCEAMHLLGVIAGQRGNLDIAIAMIRRAIEIDGKNAEAYRNLGGFLAQRGRFEEACTALCRAVELRPDDQHARAELAKVYYSLGAAWMQRGRLNEAIAAHGKAIEINPNFWMGHFALAHALRGAGRFNEALTAYGRALAIKPDLIDAHVSMAVIFAELQRFDEAMACHARAAAINPNAAIVHETMGTILLPRHGAGAAIPHFRRAVEKDPKLLSAWASLGSALQAQGAFEEAGKCFRKMLEIQPNSATALQHLAAAHRKEDGSAEIQPMLDLLDRPDLTPEQRSATEFALGKVLDDSERFDEAFAQFKTANDRVKEQKALVGERYDSGVMHDQVDRIIETFTAEFFQRRCGWGNVSEAPVFVVGMPRTGTTLVQQIVGSHPKVHGAGELKAISQIERRLAETDGNGAPSDWSRDVIERYAGEHLARLESLQPGALRVIDKMPSNLHRLGLIGLMFPSARVIVCRRDARDTCLSCYFQGFSGGATFSFDLADCGHFHRENERLMAHWRQAMPLRMLEVEYEAVVDDLEGQSRRMIDFLGLTWDEACLQFHRTQTTVLTPSLWQVRQPIYQRSVGRWRYYERHLGPLLRALAGET